MRRPFQSLGLAAGLVCLAISGASAQERPRTSAPPAADQTRPPVPIAPAGPQPDRVESTRPPDCLDCAPSPPRRPSVITNPSWSRAPQPEYPAAALAAGITDGRVTLDCLVTPAGLLTGCGVIEETPPGFGFAGSAVAAAALARISPRTLDGVAVGARVRFTIRYRMPEEPPPPPRRR